MARRKLGFWRRFIVMVVKPTLLVWTKRSWSGMQHIPGTGGVIVVANHMSHADPMVIGHYLYEAGRWPRFLGKASLFTIPIIGRWLLKVKQIPVHRGSVDAIKSLEAAIVGVDEGGALVIYPEGTTTREPDLWPMRGKTGAVRLAAAGGIPLIPFAHWGVQEIMPRYGKLRFPRRREVTVVVGEPIDLGDLAGAQTSPAGLAQGTTRLMDALARLVGAVRGAEPPAERWNPASHRQTETGRFES